MQVHSHSQRRVVTQRLGWTSITRLACSMDVDQMRERRLDPRPSSVTFLEGWRLLLLPSLGQQCVVGGQTQDALELAWRKATVPQGQAEHVCLSQAIATRLCPSRPVC